MVGRVSHEILEETPWFRDTFFVAIKAGHCNNCLSSQTENTRKTEWKYEIMLYFRYS